MNNIIREVFVKHRGLENPIPYVRATNAQSLQFIFCDFEIPEGAEARVYVQKPSGKAVYNNAVINNNKVTVDVTTQMFSELGRCSLQIHLVKESKTLVTFVQPVEVYQNYTEGDSEESWNESGFLNNMRTI